MSCVTLGTNFRAQFKKVVNCNLSLQQKVMDIYLFLECSIKYKILLVESQVFANIGKTEVQGSSLGEGLETKGCPLSIPMASGRKLKKLRPGSLKKNYLIIYFLLKLASKYFTGGGVDSKSGPLPDFGLTAATV